MKMMVKFVLLTMLLGARAQCGDQKDATCKPHTDSAILLQLQVKANIHSDEEEIAAESMEDEFEEVDQVQEGEADDMEDKFQEVDQVQEGDTEDIEGEDIEGEDMKGEDMEGEAMEGEAEDIGDYESEHERKEKDDNEDDTDGSTMPQVGIQASPLLNVSRSQMETTVRKHSMVEGDTLDSGLKIQEKSTALESKPVGVGDDKALLEVHTEPALPAVAPHRITLALQGVVPSDDKVIFLGGTKELSIVGVQFFLCVALLILTYTRWSRLASSQESPYLDSMLGDNEESDSHVKWMSHFAETYINQGGIFCSHVRSEENFARGNADPELKRPPGSPLEVEPHYHTRPMLCRYLFMGHMFPLLTESLGWALLSGSIASYLCLFTEDSYVQDWVESIKGAVSVLKSDIKFFVTFLICGEIGFYIQRWRSFMFAAWGVEGRLKDMCLAIGSDVVKPQDPATRKLLFRIYRYVVLAMALQYRNNIPKLKAMGDDIKTCFIDLGLWTAEEALVLLPSGSRMRDTVLSWIAIEVNNNGPDKSKLLGGKNTLFIMEMIAKCRGKMMYFWGNNFYPSPNTFRALMKVLVDIFSLIIIFSMPFQMMVPYQKGIRITYINFQYLTVFCVFIMLFCFRGFDALSTHLAKPFDRKADTFNIDALICGTEETVFAYLRASFDHV